MRVQMQVGPGIESAGLSDIGCQRQNNEDSYSSWEPATDEQLARKGRLFLVADGMGGYEGGQEASRIAIDTVQQTYMGCAENASACLASGFQAAHREIQAYAGAHTELHGMGTTCTAAVLIDSRLYYAHVGDSRLYLVRGGEISRLSRDDSYVGRLVENGLISAEEAETHPQRHILTAALGSGTEISPDCPENPVVLQPEDILVLCTDGLWGQVSDQNIASLATTLAPAEACQRLVQLAKDHGGPDNITLQIVRLS